MSEIKFKVSVGDEEYDCHRTIAGEKVLTQTIYVDGYGNEKDENQYSDEDTQYKEVNLMQPEALIIARRIIKDAIARDSA